MLGPTLPSNGLGRGVLGPGLAYDRHSVELGRLTIVGYKRMELQQMGFTQ